MSIEELNNNLDRLRELTDSVVPLITIAHPTDVGVEYDVKQGECRGSSLFKIDGVAVQMATMGKETTLKCHDHDEVEILILYEGELTMDFPDRSVSIKIGEPLIINPGEAHLASSKLGCKMIALTIPASHAYPDPLNNGK